MLSSFTGSKRMKPIKAIAMHMVSGMILFLMSMKDANSGTIKIPPLNRNGRS